MAVLTVTTTAQALAAIRAATAGDTILLAPGTYDGLKLTDVRKSAMVTITSRDAGNPAVLTNFSATRASGLAFSHLAFDITSDNAMVIASSRRITLDQIDVHGSLDGTSNDDFRGLLVRNSSFVTVSNSHFHELTDAFNPIGSHDVTITGNRFDTIRDDGVAGGGNSRIVIANNLFTSFDHVGNIHPDAIQVWTTGTTRPATDITITGNVIDRGTGAVIQGIFVTDDVGTLPYGTVTISDNVVVGALYNGIVVSHADNAVLRGNVVIGAQDQPSWLGVYNVASARLDDNVATGFSTANATIDGHGDVIAGALTLPGGGAYASPISAHGSLGPQVTDMAGRAGAAILAGVNLLGFNDGPSRFGHRYDFATIALDGTGGDDRLTAGSVGGYHIRGYDGNDTLVGNKSGIGGVFEGGAGDDNYTLYQTFDRVIEAPGAGNDTIYSYVSYTLPDNVENLRAMAAWLTLTGNALDNTLVAAATGGGTLYGMDGNDVLQGGGGNDELYGGAGDDRLIGNDGNDYLSGGDGDDKLYGGAGNDTLAGGAGTNYYEGGPGADTLTGGAGADTYAYRSGDFAGSLAANRDTITNFSAAGGDRISLTQVDADMTTSALDHFSFIGDRQFDGRAGELRYAADGDGITVYGDTNGDRVPDLAIHLTGLTTIAASAFTL